jgi:hypothetical protein
MKNAQAANLSILEIQETKELRGPYLIKVLKRI